MTRDVFFTVPGCKGIVLQGLVCPGAIEVQDGHRSSGLARPVRGVLSPFPMNNEDASERKEKNVMRHSDLC